ncbi:MAG TPA: B12-binding domain-containing protein, partial [Terriglobales bacterium]|nr:B12-binding domain-containing protein [Terriglobales bacterium]
MTGISLDTLRAWERRHRVVTPKRSPRGRVYTEKQVRRLILLRRAVDHGYAIGQVATSEDQSLENILESVGGAANTASSVPDATISPVLQAMESYDYAKAERELNRLATAIASPRELVHQVALPLMRVAGERLHEGRYSIAQEHMISSILTGLLASFIRVHAASQPPAKVLFATTCNERHGFPNLAAAMLTAAGGLGVIHLGTDLPADEIVMAARKSGADAVLLSLSTTADDATLNELRQIARKTPRSVALWIGGSPELFADTLVRDSRWRTLDS